MADQTNEVVQFIWSKHPELDPTHIALCVTAIGEWLESQEAPGG